jgi:2-polyprenyl-6-methoxyphenol hydroxylase-like FAD-dependent oxidoreductase
MGYQMTFLQRKDLLDVLYNNIKDRSKVLTSKKVTHVDHLDNGVLVHCEDGSSYGGDIVVGADGIHSKIREAMQEHMETTSPGSATKDMNSMSSSYNCIFGISYPVEGADIIGEGHRTYAENHSTLSFIGRGGRIFWFLFSKLDKTYHGKDIPRHTPADAEEQAKAFFKLPLTDTVNFNKVWEAREMFAFSPLEELQNEHWTADRFVCLGDAIHKVDPNQL